MAKLGQSSGSFKLMTHEKGKGKQQPQTIIKCGKEEFEEEPTKLSLCLVGKIWTLRKFNGFAFTNTMEKI